MAYFSKKYNRERTPDDAVIQQLFQNEWKGNVRELMNVIERLVVTSSQRMVTVNDLPDTYKKQPGPAADGENKTLKQVVEEVEYSLFKEAKRKYTTTTAIAEQLGISQPTAVRKLKKYKL